MSLLPFILMLFLIIVDIFFAMAKSGSKKATWLNLVAWGVIGLSFLIPCDKNLPEILNGFVKIDKFTPLFGFALSLMMMIYLVSILFEKKQNSSELLALGAFANFGLIGLSVSVELIFTLILLEIASISTYALIALGDSSKSKEASLKYFLLSSLMSAFFLLGAALIFGATGSTKYENLSSLEPNFINLVAVLFVLSMMFFKVAVFGFYRWSVDVYFGSNIAVSGFLASSFKISSFIMLIKFIPYIPKFYLFSQIFVVIAVMSMFVGNLLSIKEKSFKKLLITAGIVHAGYVFIALCFKDFKSAVFYITTYGVVTSFAFAIIGGIFGEKDVKISDLCGLYRTHKIEAFAILVISLSFIGFPFSVGFLGKFFIFSTAFEHGSGYLAMFGIINTILSVQYYFQVIISMYFSQNSDKNDVCINECKKRASSLWLRILAIFAIAFILILGSGKFYFVEI